MATKWNPKWMGTDVTPNIPAFVTFTTDCDHPNGDSECTKCGAFLCDICRSDEHSTSDGHDLSNPRYWGV